MVKEGGVTGRYVILRSATEDDAEFTRAIRNDQRFTKYLPAFENTIEQQKAWIKRQQEKATDYFFVVWSTEGERIGTISIYNIHGDHAEGGRLAVIGNPLQSIEAQLLAFKFAFNDLNLQCIDSYIFADNETALRFNKQFGGIAYQPEADQNGKLMVHTENWKKDFIESEKIISRILNRNK